MTFERSFDYALIRAILTDPAIYPHSVDDYGPAREAFEVWQHPAIWYVIAREDATGNEPGALLGLFLLACNSTVQYEIHTRLLPRAWGARATQAMRGVCAWAFANVPNCRRIVGAVPVTNRLACRFAERAGFEVWGVNRASYAKGGALVDQILFGLSPKAS